LGKLVYSSGQSEIEIEDRTLAHLKTVMIAKLRRNESFALNWAHGMDDGSGRSTIWVHPGVELEFVFYGNRRPELNREWIELLLEAANSAEGLRMIPEPEPEQAAVRG